MASATAVPETGARQVPDDIVRYEANILSRFYRLPIKGTMVGVIAMLCAIWLVESFDIGIVSTLVLVLKPHWHLTPTILGMLGAYATIGLVIAIFPAGDWQTE